MNTKPKGTERQYPHSSATSGGAGYAQEAAGYAAQQPIPHNPEGEALLKRFLSEVHGYRTIGNAALHELESRLSALAGRKEQAPRNPAPRQSARDASVQGHAHATRQSSRAPADQASNRSLPDRLRDLSTYLHADLSKKEAARTAPPKRNLGAASPRMSAPSVAAPKATHAYTLAPATAPASAQNASNTQRQPLTAPTLSPLDRPWFEERFAALRHSVAELAEQIPSRRMDMLEAQFNQLMERLEGRDTANGMDAVEAGLNKLAVYLDDSKQWAGVHDKRVRNVEARLEHLSGLVEQSHAAISATAKGLEAVAKGTGPALARHTAELVISHVEEKFGRLQPVRAVENLTREVADLSKQSQQYARATDERLKELQMCLSGTLERVGAERAEAPATTDAADAQPQPQPQGARGKPAPDRSEPYAITDGTEEAEDYDRDLIAAAQRAARLAAGPQRDLPAHGEPVRYQIPYGEFLPDEERRRSHVGLVIAAVILLTASAAMLYLNLRDKDALGFLSSATPAGAEMKKAVARLSSNVNRPASARGEISGSATLNNEAARPPVVTVKVRPEMGALTSTDTITPAAASKVQTVYSVPAIEKSSVREAAVKGEPSAQFSVGQAYLAGQDGAHPLDVNERLTTAARWFRRAAENGHAASQYRLATLYELGQGAPKDLREAETWYRRAAEAGHVKAMYNLAVLSTGVHGGMINYVTASKWFTKAAEYGLADSQYNLGILYERGLGVPQNPVKAYQWFSLAARQGDAKATQKRDAIARMLPVDERSLAEARIANWTAQKPDAQVNGAAPEPPLAAAQPVRTAVKPETAQVQVMQADWSAVEIGQGVGRDQASVATQVLDAQRLLGRLGFDPGPKDGIAGPRTVAAVRQFEAQNGAQPTGQITDALVAQLAARAK